MESRNPATVMDFVVDLHEGIVALKSQLSEKLEEARSKSSILTRYESDYTLQALKALMEEDIQCTNKISEAALIKYIELLEKRTRFFPKTNIGYCEDQSTEVNLICELLAIKLHAALGHLGGARLHPYDYLYPGLPCTQFKSSRGNFGDLKHWEYFWSESGYPIEIYACLETFEKNMHEARQLPAHVCLQDDKMKALGNPGISLNDMLRLTSNTLTAEYFKAIKEKSLDKIAFAKAKLKEAMNNGNFTLGHPASSKMSDAQLLKNGFVIDDQGIVDIFTLAKFISESVAPQDWKEFITTFDNTLLYSKCLPKLADGKTPNIRVLMDDALFRTFISNDTYYVQRESAHNNAVLFLLTELYIRIRKGQGAQIGVIGQLTGGVGCINEGQKVDAAEQVLQCFYQSLQYPLNQKDKYLIDKSATVHAAALREGRLGAIVAQGEKIWQELVSKPSPNVNASGANSNNDEYNGVRREILLYTREDLKKFADELCGMDRSLWAQHLKSNLNEKGLRALIKTEDDFLKFVRNPANYRESDETYNRAVLAIFADYYRRDRGQEEDHTGFFGKKLGSNLVSDKSTKLKLVQYFIEFLCSTWSLNKLPEYLATRNLSQHLSAMKESYNYFGQSKLAELVKLATDVGLSDFYHKQPSKGIFSAWGWN